MKNEIFSEKAFRILFDDLNTIGYRKLSILEVAEELSEKKTFFVDPWRSKQSGMEWLFEFEHEGWKARVCTSYRSTPLASAQKKDDYIAWVLVIDPLFPKEKLFSFEIRRSSEKFFDTIKEYAEAFKAIILAQAHLPCCEQCHEALHLMRIKGVMHEMIFTCRNKTKQHTQQRLVLYFTEIGIPDLLKDFIESKFARNKKYVAGDEQKGIFRTPLRVIRSIKKEEKE